MSPASTETPAQNSASSRLRGSWAPIDTSFFRDRRVRMLSRPAKLLQLACLLRSNEALLDGTLTKSDLRLAAAEADVDAKEEGAAVADLVRAGLLELRGIDYRITGFVGVSRAERERRQELARVRQQNKRERDAERDAERDVQRDAERDSHLTGHANVTHSPLPAENRDRDFVKRSEGESDSPVRPAPVRADVEQLCDHMAASVVRRGDPRPTITKDWRIQARLMLDADHRPLEEAIAVIDWIEQDSFEKALVWAIPKLRTRYGSLNLKRSRPNGSAPRRSTADTSKYDVRDAALEAARTAQ